MSETECVKRPVFSKVRAFAINGRVRACDRIYDRICFKFKAVAKSVFSKVSGLY